MGLGAFFAGVRPIRIITKIRPLSRTGQLLVTLSALLCLTPAAATAEALALPPHPRLLINSNGIAELRDRIATAPWAQRAWHSLQARTEKDLNQPVALPPRGGNWSHNYVCPEHGARLTQGKPIGPWQWEHLCPEGKHVLAGDPRVGKLDFDGNVIMDIHDHYARAVRDDGLMFQMTGDARYARRAREILLAYTAAYLTYPQHDNAGHLKRGGRVASQALSEASWLIPLVQGADLVWTP